MSDAVIAEDALQLRDVGEPRHVVEDQRLLGQEACYHQRQRGVLGAGDRDGAIELVAADDTNAIHARVHPDDFGKVYGEAGHRGKSWKFAAI